MAYVIRQNEFASFDLADAITGEVLLHGSHAEDLCEIAVALLPADQVSCLPVEQLPGGARRTVQPLSETAKETLRRALGPMDDIPVQRIKAMTLSAKVKELWNRACRFDDIPPESKFVLFSKENPWARAYNEAMRMYFSCN